MFFGNNPKQNQKNGGVKRDYGRIGIYAVDCVTTNKAHAAAWAIPPIFPRVQFWFFGGLVRWSCQRLTPPTRKHI